MVADTRGAFVMPSLYEAFGLVTVEAMTSGLPTFVSFNGGGAEIVKDGLNGFHIDPFHGAAAADKMADFFEAAKADGGASWDAVSTAARARVADRYTWPIYARRLLSLAKISGFYRSIMGEEARPRRAYQAALFHLLLRPRMAAVPAVGGEREGGGKGEDGAEKRAGGEKVDGVVCEACGRG
jgi:sucrose synthase